MLKRNWNCLKLFWPAGEWDWSPSGNLWYFKLWGNFGKREQNRNSKKKFHVSMARIYPVLISYYFLMVGLVKTNSIQLLLTRFCEIILKVMNEFICFTLHVLSSEKKQTNKEKKTKPISQAFFLPWVALILGRKHKRSMEGRKKSKCCIVKMNMPPRQHSVLSTSVSNYDSS